jgi:hypothetical protein
MAEAQSEVDLDFKIVQAVYNYTCWALIKLMGPKIEFLIKQSVRFTVHACVGIKTLSPRKETRRVTPLSARVL